MAIDRRAIAIAVVGMLFGASAMLVYQGRELNNFHINLKQATDEITDLQYENQLLTLRLQQPNHDPVVESIQVAVDAPDQLTQIEVVQVVKQDLAFLKGRPLTSVIDNPDLPYQLLNGRTIKVEQQSLTLHVNTVTVSPKLYVKVTVTPAANH